MPDYVNHELNVRFKHATPPNAPIDSIEKLGELIQNENKPEGGRKVKLYGGKHSFNHILKNGENDYLIDSKQIDGMQGIKPDATNLTVEIGGAVTLGEAIHKLSQHNLHLPIMGGWYSQTVAGLIATSTHGSSISDGSFSDYVEAVKVIGADGKETNWISGNSDEMKAWRCNLGQLGIVTRIRFKVKKGFWLRVKTSEAMGDTEAFREIHEIHSKSVSNTSQPLINMMWIPYWDQCFIRTLHPTGKRERNKIARKLERKAFDKKTKELVMMHTRAIQAYDFGVGWSKGTLDAAGRFLYQYILRGRFLKDDGAIAESFRIFLYGQYREAKACQQLRMVNNVEYAVDGLKLFDIFKRMKRALLDQKRSGNVLNYPRVHIRFTNEKNLTLIGLNQGRRTAYIGTYFGGVVDADGKGGNAAIAEDFEQIISEAGGRPHWGKYRYSDDDKFLEEYPHWDTFQRLRDEMDPNNVFSDGGANMFHKLDPFVDHDKIAEIVAARTDPRKIDPDWFPIPLYLLGNSESDDLPYGPHKTQSAGDAIKALKKSQEELDKEMKAAEKERAKREERRKKKEEKAAAEKKKKQERAKKKEARKKKKAAKKKP
ncbi:MAG: FAD/FMN-containing dehydrogenase [Verrucomicrobiales bacterium]|jgi:FAD/FMN-containing dehydrogenase